MYQITKLYQNYVYFLHHLQSFKRSLFAFLFCLPTSLLALLLVFLLVYNGFSVFYIHLPSFPARISPLPANTLPEKVAGESLQKFTSSVLYAVKEENPPAILKTHLHLLQKQNFSLLPVNSSVVSRSKKVNNRRIKFKILRLGAKSRRFSAKVKEFFENSSCKSTFFMTWISEFNSFGNREIFAMESLFKSHPNACLVMVSNSLDSRKGSLVFKPFLDKGFKVIAVKPDFDYIFKNTPAEEWFNKLKKGNIDPGFISLGQNLSNLLRLALLYKFGGIYLDTDVIVLKNLSKLRNTIGAQTMDSETKNWSRLNNAVLIFDKNHPLLFKFIQEFSLTFDGNKWGHNGPYLVSRVVSRVTGRPGFTFNVLPPSAFYPVDWSRIRSFFRGPRNKQHSKWLHNKLELIRRQSFTVHLWNKESNLFSVEDGSIVNHLMLDCCIFCNSSVSSL
ncbi:putative Alpha 1,4-glycosyltransferase family protein [Melia azedarach]|uniref:Alpha 1,4-glycosyltransferase family protein n=1 Tax=Melia azedarach TaxID=155640 RepID=A0ACC1WYM4_MELAZ|nr:putative Alpha 1,4-glycosyltransferase family protein [Melia azedarach]